MTEAAIGQDFYLIFLCIHEHLSFSISEAVQMGGQPLLPGMIVLNF